MKNKSVEQIVPLSFATICRGEEEEEKKGLCFLHEYNLVFTFRHLLTIRGAKFLLQLNNIGYNNTRDANWERSFVLHLSIDARLFWTCSGIENSKRI